MAVAEIVLAITLRSNFNAVAFAHVKLTAGEHDKCQLSPSTYHRIERTASDAHEQQAQKGMFIRKIVCVRYRTTKLTFDCILFFS